MRKTATRVSAALGIAFSLIVAAVGCQRQPTEPIKIGAIYIMSGPFATYGHFARNGIQLAVDEINADGGVLGRQLEFTIEDSTGEADVAVHAASKLVLKDRVDVLLGIDSNHVAHAMAPAVLELKRPLLITNAATPDVTGELCNKYVFRSSVNINQNLKAAALLAKETGATRWTAIGPDSTFGHQSWEFFQKYLEELEPSTKFMEPAFAKFGTQDFTPVINKVIVAKPDGVVISLGGNDLVNFVRQANTLGFFEQKFEVLMTRGAATEVLYALRKQMPTGVWVGSRYWFGAKDTAINTKFVEAYKKRFDKYPSYNAQNAYAGVYVYKAAIEKAGSTDADKVVAAMRGLTVTAPIGTFTFRAEDHQATVDGYWGVTQAYLQYPIRMLHPIRVFPSAEITPPPGETGCKTVST